MKYRFYTLGIVLSAPLILLALSVWRDPPPNPPLRPEQTLQANVSVPPRILKIMRNACFDCHSSETRWPWYATMPAVAGQMQEDVRRGRAALNFSEWSTGAGRTPARAAGTLTAACAAVEQKRMPKPPYPLLHSEARLSAADVEAFCSWTREQSLQLRALGRRKSNAD